MKIPELAHVVHDVVSCAYSLPEYQVSRIWIGKKSVYYEIINLERQFGIKVTNSYDIFHRPEYRCDPVLSKKIRSCIIDIVKNNKESMTGIFIQIFDWIKTFNSKMSEIAHKRGLYIICSHNGDYGLECSNKDSSYKIKWNQRRGQLIYWNKNNNRKGEIFQEETIKGEFFEALKKLSTFGKN